MLVISYHLWGGVSIRGSQLTFSSVECDRQGIVIVCAVFRFSVIHSLRFRSLLPFIITPIHHSILTCIVVVRAPVHSCFTLVITCSKEFLLHLWGCSAWISPKFSQSDCVYLCCKTLSSTDADLDHAESTRGVFPNLERIRRWITDVALCIHVDRVREDNEIDVFTIYCSEATFLFANMLRLTAIKREKVWP